MDARMEARKPARGSESCVRGAAQQGRRTRYHGGDGATASPIGACLASAGSVAAYVGMHEHAARILGACEAQLRQLDSVLSPADVPSFQQGVSLLRAALPPAELDAAWVAGAALPLQQAVAEALAITA